MTEEETLLAKRFKELANRSYKNNMYTFTGFLSLSEQNLFYSQLSQMPGVKYDMYGGTEDAERKVIRFGSPEDFLYEEEFPVCCIEIRPLMKKFADKLTHRDVLGSVMNLGIERAMVGDIVVKPDAVFLMCIDKMADYIVENISRIKHTSVSLKRTEEIPEEMKPELLETTIYCHSLRIDGIISKVFNLSRSESDLLFPKALVFINGKTVVKSGIPLKAGDIVSVRGHGKFIYEGDCATTQKGNFRVKIKKYI